MFRIRFWSLFLIVALLPLLAAQPAHAMVYTISSGEDLVANNGVCSLREALINANNNNQSGSIDCPAGEANATDSIILLAGQTYTLTIGAPNNDLDTAAEGDLDILNNPAALDLQLLSNGAERATIAFQQANTDNNRVLDVRGGATALLRGVKITGGDNDKHGGGIQNNGTLTLETTEVSGNRASSQAYNGGGIYTGPGSRLTIRAASVVSNNTSIGGGGGIYNEGGTLTIEASSVTGNVSRHSGGGIATVGSNDTPATLSITTNSVVSNNRAIDDTSDGGGVWNGNSSTTVIEQSLMKNNQSQRHGGAIAAMAGGSVRVSQSTLDANVAFYVNNAITGQGGAVWNAGTLTIEASTVSNNKAGNGANSHGGALYNIGTLLLFNSTVSANQTQPGTAGNGGAIANTKTLVVINSTISGNTADGRGGAIHTSGGYADIRHATITANTATIAHGGLYLVGPTPKVDLKHSIVAGNSAADCDNGFATLTSKGYNIVGTACGGAFGAATNDLVGVDPTLAALADNGGATQTHAPLGSSPALDAIPGAACADNDWPQLATDQRGIARPQGTACEIGAYEQKPLNIVNPNPTPTVTNLAPDTAPAGSSDLVMVVAGTNFVQGAVVRWNGTDRLTTFVSAAELKAGITQTDLATAGTAEVTVFNPAPGGGSSNALTFVIAAPNKQNQTITFAPLADRTLVEDGFSLNATASSSLPVTYTADGACAVSDGTVTLLKPGTCTITAGQAGNDVFNAAPDVVRAFTVTGQRIYVPLTMRASEA